MPCRKNSPDTTGFPVTDTSPYFLYGTMLDDALRAVVTGAEVPVHPATVERMAVHPVADGSYPLIRYERDAVARGGVASLTPQQAERFAYYEGIFGYTLKVISLSDGTQARVWWPPAALEAEADKTQVFDLLRWHESFGPVTREAAIEIMGYMGRFQPQDLIWRMPMIRIRAASQLAARAPKPTTRRSAMHRDKVEVVKEHTPHAGWFLTRSYTLSHPLFGGGMSEKVHREVFIASDAAFVLPYDPKRDRVLLVEQFRLGCFGRGDPHPWTLEPVAGRVDPGETPEACARRETVEEAGLDLHELISVGSHYCSPGATTEYYHSFIGLCDIPHVEKGVGGCPDEHEDIRTHRLSFDEAYALYESGEADCGPLQICLLWLSRERARGRWCA